eukprot:TRINITY_DN28435_c1_g1_i3.p2 TRINITY_DN28435_c1_g1~~TRINITY_DN28435_c1_g1_i3.p2  ORF type:complete len:117 (-),score=9.59 TRINITY_DN28435_c1_g1_i3:265-615(-)
MMYLFGGIVGSIAHILMELYKLRQSYGQRYMLPAIGASAAVNSLVVFTCFLIPQSTVYVYGVVPLPLWAVGLIWLYIDVSSLHKDTGVAVAGHLGGALAGAFAYWLYHRRYWPFKF